MRLIYRASCPDGAGRAAANPRQGQRAVIGIAHRKVCAGSRRHRALACLGKRSVGDPSILERMGINPRTLHQWWSSRSVSPLMTSSVASVTDCATVGHTNTQCMSQM